MATTGLNNGGFREAPGSDILTDNKPNLLLSCLLSVSAVDWALSGHIPLISPHRERVEPGHMVSMNFTLFGPYIMLKKILKPSKNKKFVRIDAKTFIEVNEDIPNEVAKAKFNENINVARKSNLNPYQRYYGKKRQTKT